MDKIRKVMIGTPSYDGKIDVWYVNSLVRTIAACAAQNISINPLFVSYDALIQRTRNDTVKYALESECDDLIFIDSDEEFSPDNVLALLDHDVDVVGAAVRLKTDEAELYNVRNSSIDMPVDAKTGLWIVDGIGTGFLRLSRRALMALWDRSREYADDKGVRCRMVFDVEIRDGRLMSEDISMCAKLADADIRIHLDPSFTISHIGMKKYQGNFQDWVKKQRADLAQVQA